MGFFWGVDQDSIVDLLKKHIFLTKFEPKNRETLHSLFWSTVHDRNRSGVVELVGREPWIIARVENGVTKFSPHRQKTPKFSKKDWIRKTVFSGKFSLFGRGKTNFWGGYKFKTG